MVCGSYLRKTAERTWASGRKGHEAEESPDISGREERRLPLRLPVRLTPTGRQLPFSEGFTGSGVGGRVQFPRKGSRGAPELSETASRMRTSPQCMPALGERRLPPAPDPSLAGLTPGTHASAARPCGAPAAAGPDSGPDSGPPLGAGEADPRLSRAELGKRVRRAGLRAGTGVGDGGAAPAGPGLQCTRAAVARRGSVWGCRSESRRLLRPRQCPGLGLRLTGSPGQGCVGTVPRAVQCHLCPFSLPCARMRASVTLHVAWTGREGRTLGTKVTPAGCQRLVLSSAWLVGSGCK